MSSSLKMQLTSQINFRIQQNLGTTTSEPLKNHHHKECSTTFYTINSLNIHKSTEHKKDSDLKCKDCDKVCDNYYALVSHQLMHFKPKICSICNAQFASAFGLRIHSKTHPENVEKVQAKHGKRGRPKNSTISDGVQKSFWCLACKENFETAEELEKHRNKSKVKC